jgi:hypothetical protein
MTLPLVMIASAALITLAVGYFAKRSREREQLKKQPSLPFNSPQGQHDEEHAAVASASR